jgi:hypothetical protein
MLNRKSAKELQDAARVYHEKRAARAGQDRALFDSILNDMHTLDAKSTGLITFISLVLAALTFALNLVDRSLEYSNLIKGGLIFFIAIFSVGAWFSLRCLEMTGPPFTKSTDDVASNEHEAIAEVAARRFNYFLSVRITRGAFTMLVPFVFAWVGLIVREIY